VEAGGPLPHHDFGPSIRRALFSVTWRGEPLGDVTLPVCDGRVRSDVLGDAIAARHGWSIVDRWLAGRAEGSSPAADPWTEFLRALYDAPDRPAEWFYDPEAAPVGGSDLTTPAAEGLELGEPLREVERNGARAIEVRIAGATIGVVPLPPGEGRIPASAVRAAITRACGLELVRVVAREALLGAGEDDGRPLRERLALRAARAERDPALRARRCGGFAIALPRHRPGPVETTASRRAALPEEVVRACARSFPAFGGSLVEGDGAGALYLPDLIGREDDRIPLVDEALPEAADRLPILMYHRVTGAPPRNRWALDPDVFEAQLRWLAENGFRTVGLEDLRRARLARRLPRRCVVLTFDDGTLDFETEAWPRLRAYGFAATLFVVTGFAGGTSLWDEGRVPALGLLDWRAIERMRSDGLEIGSHSERHRPLSALDPDDIAQECLRSRCAIAERLGAPPTAIAYPHGDADPVVEHLAGACGYLFGLTCESRMMTVDDRLLAMPRIEVAGDEPLAAFMQRLEPAA
jgi:peptidoglycan/xylan/chitin deacetylase (PgdA/CDA1 family)